MLNTQTNTDNLVNDFEKLKKTIHHILNLNWQYHTAGLNKETFFLSI